MTQGHRLSDGLADGGTRAPWMKPGDYWKDQDGQWWVYPPKPGTGCGLITHHDIAEHEDGTITVSPSILVQGRESWHGYLEHGVWREV